MQDLDGAIAGSPLLSGLDAGTLGPVVCRFRKGEAVLDMCEGLPAVGLVVSGQLSVSSDSPDRGSVRMSTLGPGDCFGIANLFDQEALDTILRCEQETEIAYIFKSRLIALLHDSGDFAERYARLVSAKLRFLLRRTGLLTMQSHRMRLVRYLTDAPGSEFRFPGTRDEMAAHLGMSRAALFRELGVLEAEGLIATKGRLIRILDRDGLAKLIRSDDSLAEDTVSFI